MNTALVNSFNTPQALAVIADLINKVNIHLKQATSDVDVGGLEKIARWITKIVGIFGLDANASAPYEGLGWASEASTTNSTPEALVAPYLSAYKSVKSQVEALSLHSEALDQLLAIDVDGEFKARFSSGTLVTESLAYPYVRAVSRIRDELRKIAPSSPSKKAILSLSDDIRDNELTNLGVYLDDVGIGEDQGAFIKFVPKEELLAQKAEKTAKEQAKLAQKEAARLERERLEAEKLEKAKLPPTEMFKDAEKFSAWDSNGLPTKTKAGDDVPRSALKKMTKDWERQKKVHEEWKAKAGL